MYAYDNWKLTDPNDTPENDRRDRIWELVEEEHPDWSPEDIELEVEAILRKDEEDAAEARAESIALSREMDMEGY